MSKDRRLGKGLAALLGTPQDPLTGSAPMATTAAPTVGAEEHHDVSSRDGELRLNVHDIEDNPFQPR